MGDTMTISWTDWRGNKISRTVKQVVDARDYIGAAGYPWIILAANPTLSSADLERFLAAGKADGAERSLSWIKRHRWMFPPPGTSKRRQGPTPDIDGKQARAVELMRDNPKVSARRLSYLLREHGINRSREWVLKHRCDPHPDN